MPNYIVKTNKVGERGTNWEGKVAYRAEDINKAWKAGQDLECFCGEKEPKRMIIPNAEIFTRINHRRKFAGKDKYGEYELVYYTWRATHDDGKLIDIALPQPREPEPNQKILF